MKLVSAVLALAAAGSALVGLLSWGGRFSEWLDVLTHFAPFVFAGAATLLGLSAVFARGAARSAALAFSFVGAVSSGALIAPELAAALRPLPPASAGAERLRLLQFNVYRHTADPRGVAEHIRRIEADVVFLEEAYDEAAPIAASLRDLYPHQATCAERNRPCGTRVLSKRAPLAGGGLLAPHDQDGSVNAAWLTLPLRGGRRATVVATHYTWPIPAGAQGAQSRALGAFLRRFDRDTLIVAGDFNSTPWSFTLRRQDRAFGLERRTRALFSWPRFVSPVPLLPIDHVYAGPAWTTVSVRRGPRTPSDHFPVIVELAREPLARAPS